MEESSQKLQTSSYNKISKSRNVMYSMDALHPEAPPALLHPDHNHTKLLHSVETNLLSLAHMSCDTMTLGRCYPRVKMTILNQQQE